MTAPALPGDTRRGRVPGPAVSGRRLRPAAVCRVVVASVLVAVAGLVFLALAPRLVGFHGSAVVSGSMEPRVSPGDVVLTRPVLPQDLEPGQVLLFPDPEGGDRLVLHRLVSFDARGDLVMRGDANQSNDSTHVPASSVIGEAQLRIPFVGLPTYWRLTGQWGLLGSLAVLLAAATVFAVGGPRDRVRGPRGLTTADRLPAPDRVGEPRRSGGAGARGPTLLPVDGTGG